MFKDRRNVERIYKYIFSCKSWKTGLASSSISLYHCIGIYLNYIIYIIITLYLQ